MTTHTLGDLLVREPWPDAQACSSLLLTYIDSRKKCINMSLPFLNTPKKKKREMHKHELHNIFQVLYHHRVRFFLFGILI